MSIENSGRTGKQLERKLPEENDGEARANTYASRNLPLVRPTLQTAWDRLWKSLRTVHGNILVENKKLTDPSKNFLDQQRQQEQQQRMLQEQQRRQQLYGYLNQQQKDTQAKSLLSCSVCGSRLLVKLCPTCRRFFCRIHLPINRTGSIGHFCIPPPPPTYKFAKPPPSSTNEKQVEKTSSEKPLHATNKWKCPICDHINSEETDICEDCGVYSGERS